MMTVTKERRKVSEAAEMVLEAAGRASKVLRAVEGLTGKTL